MSNTSSQGCDAILVILCLGIIESLGYNEVIINNIIITNANIIRRMTVDIPILSWMVYYFESRYTRSVDPRMETLTMIDNPRLPNHGSKRLWGKMSSVRYIGRTIPHTLS
ncbi:MAG: hypothetical protein ACLQG5_05745 [Methanobacterium sp.]|jgi:hypothetical protein